MAPPLDSPRRFDTVRSVSFRVTRVDSLAVIEMAHGRANAMDVAFFEAMRPALDEARRARAVVLTATGGIFSAGVDLPKVLTGDREYLETFLTALSDGLAELFTIPLPVVAAINGHAVAGGAIIAWACDYRLMARGPGTIGVPELRVGVPFPLVAAEIVRYALGSARAQRAMLMGNRVPAEQAVAEGFVDELVEPEALMERALAIASDLAACPPDSYARTKSDLRRPVTDAWDRLRPTHDRQTLDAWDSEPVRSSMREFVERTLNK